MVPAGGPFPELLHPHIPALDSPARAGVPGEPAHVPQDVPPRYVGGEGDVRLAGVGLLWLASSPGEDDESERCAFSLARPEKMVGYHLPLTPGMLPDRLLDSRSLDAGHQESLAELLERVYRGRAEEAPVEKEERDVDLLHLGVHAEHLQDARLLVEEPYVFA